jgi:hypothetical protein
VRILGILFARKHPPGGMTLNILVASQAFSISVFCCQSFGAFLVRFSKLDVAQAHCFCLASAELGRMRFFFCSGIGIESAFQIQW